MGIDVGQVIDGKYRVTARVGEGGMGAVYAGEHLKLHRRVAIKVLHAAMAKEPETVQRFEREAQAAGRIGNEHIVEVFDIGELDGGDLYLVMEFLDGESLDARLARLGRIAPRQVYPVARQLLEALGAAHTAGIVHRDLKPSNVFILREKTGIPDYVKLIDFGISKFHSLAADASKTRTGTIIGTPSYMSPEQARGLREADARSDIYAVGVIVYEAVTGRVPFEGTSTNDILFKIFLNEVPPIEAVAPDVDPAFCTLIMKALAKDGADRFQRAEDFIAALDAWAQTGAGVELVKSAPLSGTMIEGPGGASAPGRTPATGPRTEGSWARPDAASGRSAVRSSLRGLAITVAVVAVGASVVWATIGRHPKPSHEGDGPAAAAPSLAPTPTSTPAARLPETLPPVPPPPASATIGQQEPAPVAATHPPAPVAPLRGHRAAPASAPPAAPSAASSGVTRAPRAPPAPKASASGPDFGY